ncbi:MAG: hypothetical protein JSV32_04985 [Dehalococcoidia bacterium]|jgi:hypothetical protein|nr:MAG: hypothetical protein JSV32_04985 [Dehalococcoidia bacterium]
MKGDQLYIVKGQSPNAAEGQSHVVRICCTTGDGSTTLVEDPDGINLREVPTQALKPISKADAKKKSLLLSRQQLDRLWESASRRRRW